MALFKISIALLGSLMAPLVAGNYRYEHFKTFSFNDGAERKPWFADDFSSSPYKSESSQLVPHYASASSYPYDSLKHGTDPIPAIKKIPTEDKAFKKAVSPFYTLSDADDPKFKELILKSGAPYCQEISAKETNADASIVSSSSSSSSSSGGSDSKQMTCYRCKDPKNGAIYEHCSYTSLPEPQSGFREPRSNAAAEKTLDSLSAATHSTKSAGADKLPSAFHFSDDYFHTEASHELPAEYDRNIDNCERVVKDSMVCMVCKDPKTSGKYEQCSYVAQPNEKAYAYTKSSSFGGPASKTKPREQALKEVIKQTRKVPDEHHHHHHHHHHPRHHHEEDEHDKHEAEQPYTYHHHEEPEELSEGRHSEADTHGEDESSSSEDKEGHGSHYVPDHTYHYPSYKDFKSSYGGYDTEDEAEEEAAPSKQSKANCKTVDKEGETCTVCTDPKTGGKSESCQYSHEPKDKVYKYSKSKSFGYPEAQKSSSGSGGGGGSSAEHHSGEADDHEKKADSSDKQERESSAEDYGSYHSEPSTLDYIRSESEKISEKVKGQGDCKKVKKDSMICTVCKDPKTGGNFEQCNYSYEPDDKVFAYSKSKSFGSPTNTEPQDYGYESGSAEEHPEETYGSPAVIYPTGTSPLDYIPKTSESQLSSVYTTKRPQEKVLDSKVDSGFYDATIRRAEIEKIVKDISGAKEDRSKCKKVYRGGMTCYRCTDDKGFTNEECVYVADPAVDDTKEQKKLALPATEASVTVEVTARPTERTTTSSSSSTTTSSTTSPSRLLEPLTSTSWKSMVTNRQTRETRDKGKKEQEQQPPKDKDEELEVLDEELDEAEPYDYVAETKPIYDKVLGLTLPAYMLQRSPHEIEFDEIVESAKF